MSGFFDNFRKKVLASVWKDESEVKEDRNVDDLIALGVLLWVVAEADDQFLPEEEEKIKDVINTYNKIVEQDMPIVLRAIKEASVTRIDLYSFTSEISKDLDRDVMIGIIENLFRVACIDNDLAEAEHETIRQIAHLFRLEHDEFIDAKVKVKKEFGMDTAGL